MQAQPARLLALALLVGAAQVQASRLRTPQGFHGYAAAFGKDYARGSEEYEARRALFERRLSAVEAHNRRSDRLWTAGVNALTDWTEAELLQLHGWRPTPGRSLLGTGSQIVAGGGLATPPDAVDWSNTTSAKRGAMDQGYCGSCWAVTTAAMLEAQYEIHRKHARTFSAQELISCVENPQRCGGDGGCKGATVELGMDYVVRHGLRTAEALAYEAKAFPCPGGASLLEAGGDVQGGAAAQSLGLLGWSKLPENKALPLMLAVADGPVGISVSADGWHMYESGIFDSCPRDTVITHAVLLLGYGSAGEHRFWHIQNSWGKRWGEDGTLRVLRHATPEEDQAWCGEDRDPSKGTACEPYPKSVTVCGMCGLLYDSVVPHFEAVP